MVTNEETSHGLGNKPLRRLSVLDLTELIVGPQNVDHDRYTESSLP